MAQLDIYIDILNQAVVGGLSGQASPLPQFYQGDTPTLRIFLLYPSTVPFAGAFSGALAPYTYVGTAGLTLLVEVGQKKGTGGIVYTSQLVWAPSTDPNNPNYFIAQLPMNTVAIGTALGTGAVIGDAFLQVAYLQNGLQSTVLEVSCVINAGVIQNGGVVVPPGLNPVSLEYVNATFLTRLIIGGFTMVDPNTNKKFYVYVGDDKTLHCDEVN